MLLDGIARGMHIINGLHEFLNDDAEFVAAEPAAPASRSPTSAAQGEAGPHLFSGRIFDVTCPRIAVLGTDGAIGKRTTATLLVQALNARGIKAVMVGTGQTTLIQGGKYGVALDALVPQFCSGEVENQVVAAFEGEDPDVIVVEGQGALSHPAYMTSAHILRGSQPAGVIVQHAPERVMLGDFPMVAMPTAASEVALIESFADTKVIGITVNHEDMTDDEIGAAIAELERDLGLPATDPLTRPLDRLVDMVLPPSRNSQPGCHCQHDERAASRDRPRGHRAQRPDPRRRGWPRWASGSPASPRRRSARRASARRCCAAASPAWATPGSRTWPGSAPAARPPPRR